ncbi:MAG: hypothetical protein ACFE75_10650, partial [Candidatus Hodarchaeota archaeon]
MFYTILDDFIFYQQLTFKPIKYSNYELKLHRYFYNKTLIDPSYTFIVKVENMDFFFFFINKKDYFQASMHLKSIRNEIKNKKISIIRADHVLIYLIFNFFPDLYIHDIRIVFNNQIGIYEISIFFLKELNTYHIAVGRNGGYIKALNFFFEKHIIFE